MRKAADSSEQVSSAQTAARPAATSDQPKLLRKQGSDKAQAQLTKLSRLAELSSYKQPSRHRQLKAVSAQPVGFGGGVSRPWDVPPLLKAAKLGQILSSRPSSRVHSTREAGHEQDRAQDIARTRNNWVDN